MTFEMWEKKETRMSKLEILFPKCFCYVCDSDGEIALEWKDTKKGEYYRMKRRDAK